MSPDRSDLTAAPAPAPSETAREASPLASEASTVPTPTRGHPSHRGTFASLRLPNYRLYFFGMLLSNTGLWMSRVAQDWLVLVDLTAHSAAALGLVTAIQFLPMPLLAPFAGTLADRFPKRKLLIITQSLAAITSLLLAALVLTGHVQLWHVFALAGAQGVLNALDNPTRQAFVSEMVPPQFLPNAVALNSISFQAARLLGPGLSGLLIAAAGVGPSFVINGLSFGAVLLAVMAMNPALLSPSPKASGRGSLREGFAYVRGRPDIMLVMFLAFMFGTFGLNFQITNALMATKVFEVGPEGYGLLGSIMAVGSVAGGLVAARRARPSIGLCIAALAAFTVLDILDAFAPTYLSFAVLLIPVGMTALIAMTTANAVVQLSTDPGMRGRVMALYMAVFMGGTPLGSPIIGWIGDTFGPRSTILAGAGAVGLSVVVAVIVQVRTGAWTTLKPWRRPSRSPA